jgi:hypothetical protein
VTGPGPSQASGGTIAAPDLQFSVQGAAVAQAVAPAIALELRVERSCGGPVRSLVLAAQVRIAAPRRGYDAATKERLLGVFGPPEAWARSLTSLLWARPTVLVPGFDERAVVELHLPCSYDMQVAHAGYLAGVRDATIPLELLFSGSVFYAAEDGRLQVAQVSWEKEAAYDLPAALWQEAMDHHFPGARWMRLDTEHLDRLLVFRSRQALPTWEATVDALLEDRP